MSEEASGSGKAHLADAEQLRQTARGLLERSGQLRSLGIDRIARAVCRAVDMLGDEQHELGAALREQLLPSSGLSAPMIEWGLRTCFDTVEERALMEVAAAAQSTGGRRAVPARLAVTVLAGNVFTASLRAVVLPLLTRAPVLAKASSLDDVLPRFLKQALDRADTQVGACYQVVTFDRDNRELRQALFEFADVVSVYGSDETVQSMRSSVSAGCCLVAHGHGLGAIYVPASCLLDEQHAAEVARDAALDVAAYDQRGCLSPHFVCTQGGGRVDGADFARLLADAGLRPLSAFLPRGRLPVEAAAEQMQWRGVAAARGRIFGGEDFAVSFEGEQALRASPGFRNVGVYECKDEQALADGLRPFGVHLKALGVAGGVEVQKLVAAALAPALAPRISKVGQMQKPPLHALADGLAAMAGLVRWIEVADE